MMREREREREARSNRCYLLQLQAKDSKVTDATEGTHGHSISLLVLHGGLWP